MSAARRLALIAVVALLALAAAIAALADVSGREFADKVGRGRTTYLLGVLRNAAETNISYGIPLDQVTSLQALIEREKISDPSILAIDLFYPEGQSLFSTDRGALGEPVPQSWVEALAHPAPWRLDERGEVVFGTTIENDLGTAAGGIAITVSDTPRAARAFAQRLDLVGLALLVGIGSALLGAIAMGSLARLVERPFGAVVRGLAGRLPDRAPRGRLEKAAFAARQRWVAANAAAAGAMQELRAMDDA
ncbi:hypothetical protein [Ancylobacter lacus]|uniref:hypothetical protein n=1 Tax=Ancylobacter lacus TaxID=2579970 RepID=UPI001BCBBB65|nr:hypothetical protein [Ancylobacter lacus]MBS7538324.1 hypothetical protein [Ancylobacter lacus]